MVKGATYGNLTRPSGRQHLAGFESSNSALSRFLYPITWRDTVFVKDDFTGNVINTHLWTVGNTAGTLWIGTSTQLANGTITGVTGATNGDEQAIHGEAVWNGNLNCGMEIRFKIDDATGVLLETGFTDPLTAITAPAINDVDSPSITNGATDVAIVVRDTGQTLTTFAYVTDGSTASMDTTATSLGTRSPTNATFMTVRVQLSQFPSGTLDAVSNLAASSAYLLDANDGVTDEAHHGDAIASQIAGNVLLRPWFYVAPLASAARTVDIDYIAVWQDRR